MPAHHYSNTASPRECYYHQLFPYDIPVVWSQCCGLWRGWMGCCPAQAVAAGFLSLTPISQHSPPLKGFNSISSSLPPLKEGCEGENRKITLGSNHGLSH